MSEYKFEAPVNGPEWCTTLSSKLTSCFLALSNQISTLDNKPSDKLDEVKKSLYFEIRKAENKAQQALDLALSNESALKSMKSEMFDIKRRKMGFSKKVSYCRNNVMRMRHIIAGINL